MGEALADRDVLRGRLSRDELDRTLGIAAKMRGIKACIVMLDQSVPHKVEGTKSYGAEVILGGNNSVLITERAEREAEMRLRYAAGELSYDLTGLREVVEGP